MIDYFVAVSLKVFLLHLNKLNCFLAILSIFFLVVVMVVIMVH